MSRKASPHKMIKLERLNGDDFYLNALLIEQVQSHPDTTITLSNGKKIVVKTDEAELMRRVNAYYKKIGLFGTQNEEVK